MHKKCLVLALSFFCAVLFAFPEGDLAVTEIPDEVGWGSLSPDGATVVIAKGDSDENTGPLVLFDLESGEETVVLKGRGVYYPRLDPEGRKIVFVGDMEGRRFGGIWTIGADGKGLRPFGSKQGANVYDSHPMWSPDGTMVAWARDSELWIANADGSGARALVRSLNDGEAVIGWPMDWLDDTILTLGTTRENSLSAVRVVDAPTGKVADTKLRTTWAQFCESPEYLLYCPNGEMAFHFWSVPKKAEAKDAAPLLMDTDNNFSYPEFTRSSDSSTLLLCETDCNGEFFLRLYLVASSEEE